MDERINLLCADLMKEIREALAFGNEGKIPILKSATEAHTPRLNIYRVLQTEEGMRLLSLAADKAHRVSDVNSDFENFEELLCLLPKLSGTAYFRYAVTALKAFSGFCGSIDPKEAGDLWTEANRRLASTESEGAYRTLSVTAIAPLLYPDVDLLREYPSLDAYASHCMEALTECDAVRIELTDLCFQRPDPYHAECGFRAACAGEATAESRMWLASQLLRIIGGACRERGIVWILSGYPSANTEELLGYLKRNERLPRVMLSVSLASANAVDTVLRSAEQYRVLELCSGVVISDVLSSPMQALYEAFRTLTKRYPIGSLTYLPVGETQVENLIEYTQLLHLLSLVLSEAVCFGDCADKESAALIGRDLLYRNAERMRA